MFSGGIERASGINTLIKQGINCRYFLANSPKYFRRPKNLAFVNTSAKLFCLVHFHWTLESCDAKKEYVYYFCSNVGLPQNY